MPTLLRLMKLANQVGCQFLGSAEALRIYHHSKVEYWTLRLRGLLC